MQTYGAGQHRPFRVWSAGCASGEEPYTLAMILAEFAAATPGFDFHILATDISTRVLEIARLGVYRADKAEPVPPSLKRHYLLRSRDPEQNRVRIVPELRSKVTFRRLNFMDEDYGVREPFDILFCRNVLIYFERPTAGASSPPALPPPAARTLSVHRSFGDPERDGSAARSRGTFRLPAGLNRDHGGERRFAY